MTVTGPRRVNVLELRSVRGTGGGPEKTILLGAARADTSRVNVLVCYVRDVRDKVFGLGGWAHELGVNYVEVPEQHSLDLSVLRKLTSLVREHRIDIVHAHEYKTDLLAWLLARRTGIVAMATAHGWTGQSLRERLLYYPADKWILARLARTIAVSSDIRHQILKFGARPDKVTVILNAIDSQAFRRRPENAAAARATLGVDVDDVIIGAVGRTEQQKRFDLLLTAMRRILQTQPRARLVIVGDGSLLDSLKDQAARLQVASRVVFTGHRTDIADIHNAFDVFVQSSEYEGTPNAVLEAMAMETPVVATAAGGTSELFTPDVEGLLVPCRDVRALEDAILNALSDPVAAQHRATAARLRIETELSFEVRTRRLESIYTELANA
jgi:glycosyltransferase involved in cell wall biosynthesis